MITKHQTKIVKKEDLAGFIVFFIDHDGVRKYLVLRKYKGFCEFPKGHQDEGESSLTSAFRELAEETGLKNVEQVQGFQEEFDYSFIRGKYKILSHQTLYLGKTTEREVILSREHKEFVWLPFQEAVQRLTFENARAVLRKAEKFLNPNHS